MKKQKGITLIALVITIIVLLILVGVSLRLVAGNEGILGRAEKAVKKSDIGSIKEEIEMAMAEKILEFYEIEQRPVGVTTAKQYITYILESEDGLKTSNGIVKLENETITYTSNNGTTVTGTYDEESGSVTIVTENKEKVKQSLVSQIIAENYGDKVNYSVTVNGVELNDWKIFYKDKEKNEVVMILADYLPNNTNLANKAGLINYETYSVYSEIDKKDLVGKLSNQNNWKDLLTDKMKEKKATALGGVDLETWVASWNESGYTKLYTAKRNEIEEYYIGMTENPTRGELNLASNQGYGNTTYFPHQSNVDGCCGYWITSISAYEESKVISVDTNGYVKGTDYMMDSHSNYNGQRSASCDSFDV